ncbi:leucine rich repeat protein [Leptospira santarosai str. CBC1531]|nr:leucine rich repeat protein [Leptospira santarosai str. CBC1531]
MIQVSGFSYPSSSENSLQEAREVLLKSLRTSEKKAEVFDEVDYTEIYNGFSAAWKKLLSDSHQITKSKNHKNIPKITKLYIRSSDKITSFQELKFFTRLEELTIIEPIQDASVLEELKNLKKIELQKWNVKDLVVLNSCAQLEKVELRYIQGFESDFDYSELLSESKAKIELYLDSTKFERFPTAVSTFKSLTSLSMRDCNFTEIPESIGNLKRLTDLNLGKNKLSALPAGIGKLEQLIHLYLDSNQFSIFPDAVLSLKNLQSLWIRWNQIVSLPEGIGQMNSLKELSLHENQLSDVPSAISKMAQLAELNLGKNKLTKFPEAVTLIKNLRILDLSENQITSIPDSIGAISTLEVLDLKSTLIDSLPKTIEELTSLETLYLKKTKLKDLPDFFASMKSLKNIYFESEEYNKLKQWCEFEYSKYKTHLDSKKFPEAATRIKWLFSQKGADFLKLNQWEVKLKISEGSYRKAETFATVVYALATILKDEEIFSIASRMTGDQYIHAVLPFNQACYFAVTGQKESMLQSIRRSVELGAKADEFMNEKDFDPFKKDPDFLEAIVPKSEDKK